MLTFCGDDPNYDPDCWELELRVDGRYVDNTHVRTLAGAKTRAEQWHARETSKSITE